MAELVTNAQINEWQTTYQMGAIWNASTELQKIQAVDLVELTWKSYQWKVSPFVSEDIFNRVLAGYIFHSRAILENQGQPLQDLPGLVASILEPYLGFGIARIHTQGSSTTAGTSTGTTGGGGGGQVGVDATARAGVEENRAAIGTLNTELDQAESNIAANTLSLQSKTNTATTAQKLNRTLDNLGTVSTQDAATFRAAIGAGGGGQGLDRDAVDARIVHLRPNPFTDEDKTDIEQARGQITELQHQTADLEATIHSDWANLPNPNAAAFKMVPFEGSIAAASWGVNHEATSASGNYLSQMRIPLADGIEQYRLVVDGNEIEPTLWSEGAPDATYRYFDALGFPNVARGKRVVMQFTTRSYHTTFSGDVVTPTRGAQPATKAYVDARPAGTSFTPTKQNLYSAVRQIFHPDTNAGVSADDVNNELDVTGGGGTPSGGERGVLASRQIASGRFERAGTGLRLTPSASNEQSLRFRIGDNHADVAVADIVQLRRSISEPTLEVPNIEFRIADIPYYVWNIGGTSGGPLNGIWLESSDNNRARFTIDSLTFGTVFPPAIESIDARHLNANPDDVEDGQVLTYRGSAPGDMAWEDSPGISRDDGLALMQPWARAGNADDIPASKTFDPLFTSENETAIPGADVSINFDVGVATDTTTRAADVPATSTFAITSQQAAETQGLLRVDYNLVGTIEASAPYDIELLYRDETDSSIIGKHNVKDTGAGKAEFPVGANSGNRRWLFRVRTAGRFRGTLHITNTTFHDAEPIADAAIEAVVHPIVSDEAEKRQEQDAFLRSEIERVENLPAIVDALPEPTNVFNQAITWASPSMTSQQEANRYRIPDTGFIQAEIPAVGISPVVPVSYLKQTQGGSRFTSVLFTRTVSSVTVSVEAIPSGADDFRIGVVRSVATGDWWATPRGNLIVRHWQLAREGDNQFTFLGLPDTPNDYSGQAGKAALVNTAEDGLVFGDPPGAPTLGGISTALGLGAPAAGNRNQLIIRKSDDTGYQYKDPDAVNVPDAPGRQRNQVDYNLRSNIDGTYEWTPDTGGGGGGGSSKQALFWTAPPTGVSNGTSDIPAGTYPYAESIAVTPASTNDRFLLYGFIANISSGNIYHVQLYVQSSVDNGRNWVTRSIGRQQGGTSGGARDLFGLTSTGIWVPGVTAPVRFRLALRTITANLRGFWTATYQSILTVEQV